MNSGKLTHFGPFTYMHNKCPNLPEFTLYIINCITLSGTYNNIMQDCDAAKTKSRQINYKVIKLAFKTVERMNRLTYYVQYCSWQVEHCIGSWGNGHFCSLGNIQSQSHVLLIDYWFIGCSHLLSTAGVFFISFSLREQRRWRDLNGEKQNTVPPTEWVNKIDGMNLVLLRSMCK